MQFVTSVWVQAVGKVPPACAAAGTQATLWKYTVRAGQELARQPREEKIRVTSETMEEGSSFAAQQWLRGISRCYRNVLSPHGATEYVLCLLAVGTSMQQCWLSTSRESPRAPRDARPQKLATHVSPVVAARRVVIFLLAVSVTNPQPIPVTLGKFRYNHGVKRGRIHTVETGSAAKRIGTIGAGLRTTLCASIARVGQELARQPREDKIRVTSETMVDGSSVAAQLWPIREFRRCYCRCCYNGATKCVVGLLCYAG